jgi:hypothetical protein
MKPKLLLTVTMLAAASTASAAGWTTTPLALENWSRVERGQPGSMSWHFHAEYKKGGTYFAFGCAFSSELSVSWDPGKPVGGTTGVETQFSVNGQLVATQRLVNSEGGTSFRFAEDEGPARQIVEAIAAAGVGTITVTGGGVTSKIPFDNSKMENIAVRLVDCGT